jgi:hypothetical protein
MTDTTQAPLTITLDPAVWYRGRGSERSKLLRFDTYGNRQQCCLGIAATAVGVPDAVLKDVAELQTARVVAELPTATARPLLELTRDLRHRDGSALAEIYIENDTHSVLDDDDADLADAERVERINRLTEPFGLRFVLGS